MEHIGKGFQIFMQESGAGREYMSFVQTLSKASALDRKTQALAYLSVLAAAGLSGGMDFHVREAKLAGASRDEVRSAVLVGMPAVGLVVMDGLEAALAAYDAGSEAL